MENTTGFDTFVVTISCSDTPAVNINDTWENEFMKDFKYVVNGILGTIICVLGLLGNMLTMIILTRRNMRSSTNCYLLSLAIWDSIVLISTLLLSSFVDIPSFASYQKSVFPMIVPFAYPVALTAQTSTIWLTVSFTVERYIAVCHPMRASSMCTIKRARIVIVVVSIVSLLYNITRWLEYKTVETTNGENYTIYNWSKTQSFGKNSVYQRVYFAYLYLPMMCIVPLAALAVLNTFLIVTVKRSTQKRREQMNVRQSRENNVTVMLSSVVIVFIICQVPALVYNVVYGIDMDYASTAFGYKILSEIRNFSVTLNSAVNIILYCSFGQKFRKTFVQTFFRCLLTAEQLTVYGSVYSNGQYAVERRPTHKQHIEMNANCKKHIIFNSNHDRRRYEQQNLLECTRQSSTSKGSAEYSDTNFH